MSKEKIILQKYYIYNFYIHEEIKAQNYLKLNISLHENKE
jgi:hypothetical protein